MIYMYTFLSQLAMMLQCDLFLLLKVKYLLTSFFEQVKEKGSYTRQLLATSGGGQTSDGPSTGTDQPGTSGDGMSKVKSEKISLKKTNIPYLCDQKNRAS